jgi:chromate reductase
LHFHCTINSAPLFDPVFSWLAAYLKTFACFSWDGFIKRGTCMTTSTPLHILGFSGSLRKGSYNTALLRAAADLLPAGMTLEIFDLSPLPMFNPDFEKPFPKPVDNFRSRLAQADALLIATPEYNSSVSGALKNALDWASRPPKQPLIGKPVAIMGVSTGSFGTVRAQLQLRQILTHVGALTLNKPEVLVARAEQAFDNEGHLIDPTACGFLRDLLVALGRWTLQVSPVKSNVPEMTR